jgi:hypothetical protein
LKLKAYLKPPFNWRSCCWCTNWASRCMCLLFLFFISAKYFTSTIHSKNWSIWTTYLGWGRRKARATCNSFLTIAFMISNFNSTSLFFSSLFSD